MEPFTYRSVDSVADAREALQEHPEARLIAGGTTLVDLMKAGVETPSWIVDINRLPLAAIEVGPDRVRIGALARNADVADDPTILREFPALAEALAAGASDQLRNMATVGGNLLQRTRCPYFRDNVSRCNKRSPGSGCDAREGYSRMHALLGTSDGCIATNASDMNVALAALDARVIVARDGGEVSFPFDDFYRLPGATPQLETILEHADVIVAVELTPSALYRRSHYIKLRDRASYEFALVSAAGCLQIACDGTIEQARLALGGVVTVPRRARPAEEMLRGMLPSEAAFRGAAAVAFAGAESTAHNAFKAELGQRAVVRAFRTLAGSTR